MSALRRIAILLLLLVPVQGLGHELRPSVLTMVETAPGVFDVRLKVSVVGPLRVRLSVAFPEQCEVIGAPNVSVSAAAEVRAYTIDCDGALGQVRIAIDGLRGTFNDVLVRVEREGGAVQSARVLPEAPWFDLAAAPTQLGVFATYTALGTQHILLGLDHLLFVLALLVLIRSVRALVATVTAFTVAHSITLALSAIGLASAPQAFVEVLVALSIVFVAVEIVKGDRGEVDRAILPPSGVACSFGLLHGLGFGGALKEIGLPAGEIPLALLAFNVGVELGQLAIVALALATVFSLRLLLAPPPFHARLMCGYAIGAISATWFFQRLGDVYLA